MVRKSWFTNEHDRVEIPKEIKMDVFKRVLGLTKTDRCPDGNVRAIRCEKCGKVIGSKGQYDHIHAEVFNNMHPNERPPITADDAQFIGLDCCHKDKSKAEVKARAKADRLAMREAGVSPKGKKQRGRWATGKDSPWKAKVGGGVVRRSDE